MRFSLLLNILSMLLKRTAKKSPEFKKKLKEKNYTMVIRTADGSRARFFTFQDGEVISGKGDKQGAEISLIWKDPATGFKVMTSRNNQASMDALQNGSLKLQGDANLALFFMGVVKDMMKPKK